MKKFSKVSKLDNNNEKDDIFNEKLSNMIKKCLNIQVNGDLDHYLNEHIEIDGKDKLIDDLRDFIGKQILDSNKTLLEQIKYQGMMVVEKRINNND